MGAQEYLRPQTEPRYNNAMVEWRTSEGLTDYDEAVAFMEARVAAIRNGEAGEMVWLVEHPPLYTGGTSADAADLLDRSRFPVYETGRGGEYTYHGPGQRVAYVMLDLEQRGKDIRAYVKQLEQWIIQTLAQFGIEGFTREGRIGVWVEKADTSGTNDDAPAGASLQSPVGVRPIARSSSAAQGQSKKSEAKIAALGIRVRKWVSYHGIAINIAPDLSHYAGIVPCGISEFGVTSMKDISVDTTMKERDAQLHKTFNTLFTNCS